MESIRKDDCEEIVYSIKVYVTKWSTGETRLLMSADAEDEAEESVIFETKPCKGHAWELFGKHCECSFSPAVVWAVADREFLPGVKTSGEKTFFESFTEVRLHFELRDHEDGEPMSARQTLFCMKTLFDDE